MRLFIERVLKARGVVTLSSGHALLNLGYKGELPLRGRPTLIYADSVRSNQNLAQAVKDEIGDSRIMLLQSVDVLPESRPCEEMPSLPFDDVWVEFIDKDSSVGLFEGEFNLVRLEDFYTGKSPTSIICFVAVHLRQRLPEEIEVSFYGSVGWDIDAHKEDFEGVEMGLVTHREIVTMDTLNDSEWTSSSAWKVILSLTEALKSDEYSVGSVNPRVRVKAKIDGKKVIKKINEVIYISKTKTGSIEVDGESVPVDWSHQWEVRGHWRRVRGIGKDRSGDYRVKGFTWVPGFTKGPRDKPLIKKTRVLES